MGKTDTLFIVNDFSQDKTRIIAEKVATANTKISILNYTLGPTRRENLAQSFRKATGDIIVFIDVDLICSLRFLPDLIDQIVLGSDIALGSRYARGSKIRRKPSRFIISILYNALMRGFFHTDIKDHTCGFKAFKKGVILKIVSEMGYDRTLERGIFWDVEVLVRAKKYGYKIKEIPIWWKEREKSALYFRREIKTIKYMLSLTKINSSKGSKIL